MTLKGGSTTGQGGAILNFGVLKTQNSIITLNESVSHGGGIYNRGLFNVHIADTTISHNKAGTAEDITVGQGGGMSSEGFEQGNAVTIINSAIVHNQATFVGGGIMQEGENGVSKLTIISSTIANNTQVLTPSRNGGGGGLFVEAVDVTIKNSTIAGNSAENGGGIEDVGSDTKLQNTILAGNSAAGSGPDCTEVISLGNNVIGSTAGCAVTLLPSDLTGDPLFVDGDNNGEPDFVDDGSPGGGHFALQSTSPAVDAGNNDVYLSSFFTHTDQLNQPRTDGDNDNDFKIDIGAVEMQSALQPNRYRFVVFADTRANDCSPQPGWDLEDFKACVNEPGLKRVMESILKSVVMDEKGPPPAFLLFGGDFVKGKTFATVENELKAWIDIVDDVMGEGYSNSRVIPALGSHERSDDSNKGSVTAFDPFSDAFDPVNESMLACNYHPDTTAYGHTVYCCDYLNSRFHVLNNDSDPYCSSRNTDHLNPTRCTSNEIGHEIGPVQRNWLGNNLGPGLNFFVHHECAYGVGAHGPPAPPNAMDKKPVQRDQYIGLIGGKATMLFAGHEHHYTRRLISPGSIVILATPMTVNTGPRTAESYEDNPNLAPLLHIEYYTADPSDLKIIERRVSLGSDDAEEFPDGSVDLASSDLELMREVNGQNRGVQSYVGMRWTNIRIPLGATISKAFIEFTVDEAGTDPADIRFFGQATGHTLHFTNANFDLSTRSKTTAFVDWAGIEGWTNVGDTHRTSDRADLSSIIQEIVDGNPDSFGREFSEVKTGTAGAPWYINFIPGFLNNVVKHLIDIRGISPWFWDGIGNPNNHEPYHYAVVDVDGNDVALNVFAVTKDKDAKGVPIRIPIDLPPESGVDSVQTATATGAGVLTVDAPGLSFNNVETFTDSVLFIDQGSKPDANFLFGLLGMDIVGLTPGQDVTMTLTYPFNIPTDYEYWKFDEVNGWYNLGDQVTATGQPRVQGLGDGDNRLTLILSDGPGMNGDGDNTADGSINDPGGLGGPVPFLVNGDVTFEPNSRTYQTMFDTDGCTRGEEPEFYSGKFRFDATLYNRSNYTLSDLLIEVAELSNGNVLQNADGGPGGVKARLTITEKDGWLKPGESVDVKFVLCLREIKPFRFFVDVRGFAP